MERNPVIPLQRSCSSLWLTSPLQQTTLFLQDAASCLNNHSQVILEGRREHHASAFGGRVPAVRGQAISGRSPHCGCDGMGLSADNLHIAICGAFLKQAAYMVALQS